MSKPVRTRKMFLCHTSFKLILIWAERDHKDSKVLLHNIVVFSYG